MNYQLSFWGVLLLASSLFLPAARAEAQSPFSIAQYQIPSSAPARAPNQYPEDVRTEFMTSCQEGMASSGLNATQSQQLCQCTLGNLQARYSFNQLLSLLGQTTNEPPQALVDIARACARQVSN